MLENGDKNALKLFQKGKIGSLELPNRIIRSATAERMADEDGHPTKRLLDLYRKLAEGGSGLLITGHMFIHPGGKCHPEMTGVYSDDLVPDLAVLAESIHSVGGKVVAQINHGGMQCSEEMVQEPVAPSEILKTENHRAARELAEDEIICLIDAYSQAARRVKEAGFDGVQIHAAHGYLVSQFLSPAVNHRRDSWGGALENRMRFLREIIRSTRHTVGNEFPILIKLGMIDGIEGGLSQEEGAKVVASLNDMSLDGYEISGGFSGKEVQNVRAGIRKIEQEAYFRSLAETAKNHSDLPLILVGGFRSLNLMEDVIEKGDADFISLCRPLINQPDLPVLFRDGIIERSGCVSGNRCWPEHMYEGISCKCSAATRQGDV